MPNTSNALESLLQRVHRTSAQPAGSAETRMESSAHTVRLRQSGAMPVKPRSRQCRRNLNTSPITHGSLPVPSGIKTSVVAARMPPAAVAARNLNSPNPKQKTNMYCLEVITSINDRASARQLQPKSQSRDCSFHIGKKGIVLHSARHRDTIYIHAESKIYCKTAGYLRALTRLGNQTKINATVEKLYSKYAA
ncbi:hypothetical protein UFOVP861_12 [uncultured Caudovirales phage]|uniref:Uncharacterized protein n=1 Tax=uncultured Caudovirales phage TaxID=2100421 RepID=A0A6J5PHY7_9CAUD|nr:hypothetical protein UFOVP861_12 [uncultured Caudovirales phage]